MSVMEGLTLTQREQARLGVLNRVLQGFMGVGEAAHLLGVSERHAWRMLAAYREEGAAALAHGNRGRRPANTIPEEIRQQVITLAGTRYARLNQTHFTDLLEEREGVILARSTVRNILVGAGIGSPRRRRPPRHRVRRERFPQEGMLVQIDGSHHDWLGGRGPVMALLLAVDDATGTVPWSLFRYQEDTYGYFLLFQGILERRGIPLAVYSDRHAVFQFTATARCPLEDHVARDHGLTQFGRAMGELGVTQIFARSPEAKGRVERAAGTLQDRLVAELRLAGASTLDEANCVLWEFLPRYNQRFGVPAAHPASAYRPMDPDLDLAGVLCFKHNRKVARDNTVKYQWRPVQLLPGPDRPSYAGTRVEVQERLDGRLVVSYQGRIIPSREAPPRPSVLRMANGIRPWEPTTTLQSLAMGVTPGTNGGHPHREGAAAGSYRQATNGVARRLGRPRSPAPPTGQSRRPTPRQQARWRAVQKAKRRGLGLRAIARELGIHRNTARKYAAATIPPTYPKHQPSVTTGVNATDIIP